MRPAHHAGHLMPGPRQPHREMAADGARAENAYAHGGDIPFGRVTAEALVSTSLRRSATGHAISATRRAENDGSMPDVPAYCPPQSSQIPNKGIVHARQSSVVEPR